MTKNKIPQCNRDFFNSLHLRRQILIDQFTDAWKGKRILELGPHAGFFTEKLLTYSKSVTVIENNSVCIPYLKKKIGRRGLVIEGDMHSALRDLKPGSIDIVVCAGVLYHSASPFYLLEGICQLRPQKVLVDTFTNSRSKGISLNQSVPLNEINFRYNRGPDCRMSVLLGSEVIQKSFLNMGYRCLPSINKNGFKMPTGSSQKYFQSWKKGFTAWFEIIE